MGTAERDSHWVSSIKQQNFPAFWLKLKRKYNDQWRPVRAEQTSKIHAWMDRKRVIDRWVKGSDPISAMHNKLPPCKGLIGIVEKWQDGLEIRDVSACELCMWHLGHSGKALHQLVPCPHKLAFGPMPKGSWPHRLVFSFWLWFPVFISHPVPGFYCELQFDGDKIYVDLHNSL